MTACGDEFPQVAEGDCVSGNIRIDSNLRVIDCAVYDPAADHHRVQAVFENEPRADCPMGRIGIEDRDRLVCFGR